MHEMGIALRIIEIAAAAIPDKAKDGRIQKINVEIGKLSTVVPDSLRFCFDIASKETPARDAELIIEEIPVIAECRNCTHQWEPGVPVFICPECGSGAVEIISGRELSVKSIELED